MNHMADLSPLLFRPADAAHKVRSTFISPSIVVASSSDVVHGRGLVATRDIKPGKCLFVTPPTVSANVDEVKRLWGGGSGRSIEDIAEVSLLKNMKRCVKAQDKAAAASFMALTSSHCDTDGVPDLSQYDGSPTDVLLGRCKAISSPDDEKRANDKNELLGIIRHNAFGPDYHNYTRIEQTWTTSPSGPSPYRRILGVYPLAAIINHACCSNAVRVFAGEIMVVHANAVIKEGEEIVWSYLPPGQSYHARQEQLSGKYGFCCQCKRCVLELKALELASHVWEGLKSLDGLNTANLPETCTPKPEEFDGYVELIEKLLSDPLISNEASRSLRLGHANFFINYFNTALSNMADRGRILSLATNLHFAFVSFHNASTEHLSILHLCYELVVAINSAAEDKSKTTKQVAFWTEQLRRAHQVRYGKLGNDISSVREALKHTRCVLRNLDGLHRARWAFI